MHTKECRNCNIIFETRRKNQLFCSIACATSNRQKIKDPNFLNTLNKEDLSYLIGLLFADGCISQQNGMAERITLSLSDLDIVLKLKNFMCPDRKLYSYEGKKENHSMAHVLINTNIEAINFLKTIGITHRKSNIVNFPKVDTLSINDFVRGYFDGNGSIYINKVAGINYKHISITTGSLEFANSFIYEMRKYNFYFKLAKDKRHSAYYMKLYKKDDIIRFKEWIYTNSKLFIQRKFDKFNDDIV